MDALIVFAAQIALTVTSDITRLLDSNLVQEVSREAIFYSANSSLIFARADYRLEGLFTKQLRELNTIELSSTASASNLGLCGVTADERAKFMSRVAKIPADGFVFQNSFYPDGTFALIPGTKLDFPHFPERKRETAMKQFVNDGAFLTTRDTLIITFLNYHANGALKSNVTYEFRAPQVVIESSGSIPDLFRGLLIETIREIFMIYDAEDENDPTSLGQRLEWVAAILTSQEVGFTWRTGEIPNAEIALKLKIDGTNYFLSKTENS